MLPVQLNSEMVTCELEVAQNWHVCNALLRSACDPLCELRSLRDIATLNPPRRFDPIYKQIARCLQPDLTFDTFQVDPVQFGIHKACLVSCSISLHDVVNNGI